MKHVVKHDLDLPTAKRAAEHAWESYRQRYSEYQPTATWTSDRHADIGFSLKGMSLKGAIDLEPNAITLNLDVPFLFRMFTKQAITVIDREIQHWIGKAKAGEI